MKLLHILMLSFSLVLVSCGHYGHSHGKACCSKTKTCCSSKKACCKNKAECDRDKKSDCAKCADGSCTEKECKRKA